MVQDPADASCLTKTATAATVSGVFGAVVGAVDATWRDVPTVYKNQPWPALRRTGTVMGSAALTFAAVGAAYTATDCALEELRGKKDLWNGAAGGVAAGALMGFRIGRLGAGVGCAAALAAASLLFDVTGGKLAPSDRQQERYPYPKLAASTENN
eukprot:jgi/Chlat1/8936/Chrsp94S08243